MKKKNTMQDDPLQFLLTFMGAKTNMKILKIILVFIICYVEFFIAIGLLIIYLNNSLVDFRRYLTSCLVVQPGVVSSFIILKNINKLKSLQSKITYRYCQPINVIGKRTEMKILRECRNIKIITFLFFILSFVTHLSFLPIVGDENRISIINMVIENYFGALSSVLHMIDNILTIIISYIFVFLIYFVVYSTCHVRFQIYLLRQYTVRISENFTHINEFKLIHNEEYQRIMGRRLKLYIIQHGNIKRLTNKYFEIVNYPLGYFPILGSLTIMSMVYFIIEGVSPSSNFRIVLALVFGFCFCAVPAIYGQFVTNESENLFDDVTRCPWINWNKKNRRSFLLILAYTMKFIKISFFNLVDLDVSLIIKKELDEVVLQWNSHRIRRSKNRISPSGRPIIMYETPEVYNTEDYKIIVPRAKILTCQNECKYLVNACDKDVYELCIFLMNEKNLSLPENPYDALDLYKCLRNEILILL